jgi:diguanylate cyclase (GGDEF)-like protein
MVARIAPIAMAGLLTALAVAAGGGGDAFWLCVPFALLATAPAQSRAGAAMAAAVVVVAACVPAAVEPGIAPLPSPILVIAVVGCSVAVMLAVRARLEGERSAMRHWALTDPLTGAANRRGLGERIEYEVARHARAGRHFAVVAIDLDGFKLVNDRFGHHAGDELLRDVAAALEEVVRDQDTVARLGGDEFCVLAPETGRPGGAQLGDKVSAAIARVTTGLDTLSASVGVAVYPEDGTTPLAVLDAADVAQIAAKRARGRSERRAA